MSVLGDIIDRVLFPNREIHVIPSLDGAFTPNQRLDHARALGPEIELPPRHRARTRRRALRPDGAPRSFAAKARISPTRAIFAPTSPRRSAASPLRWMAGLLARLRLREPGLVALSRSGEIVARGWRRSAARNWRARLSVDARAGRRDLSD